MKNNQTLTTIKWGEFSKKDFINLIYLIYFDIFNMFDIFNLSFKLSFKKLRNMNLIFKKKNLNIN